MRRAIIAVGIFWGLLFAGKAEATIVVKVAEVQNGVAVVQGSRAVPNADISWEGTRVTKANKSGNFSFSGVVPADCVGTLSDGTPIEVTLLDCTPIGVSLAPVPQTGQTLCYDTVGAIINCSGTGQDGAVQKGVELPTPRFTDNLNGTVKDNLTGLIWLKNADCIGTVYPSFDNDFITGDGTVTWQHALDFVAGINAGTYNCGDTSAAGKHQTDWRLPNIRELYSLVDFAFFDPAISNATGTAQGSSSDPFSNFLSEAYWSSTTIVGKTNFSWGVGFQLGSGSDLHKTQHFGPVIAVRGGS